MGLSIAESISQLEACDPDEPVTVKFAFEYALVMGVDAGITEACWKLDIEILEKHITGFLPKTMHLRLRGKAGSVARFLRWLGSEMGS